LAGSVAGNVPGSTAEVGSGATYERLAETFAPIHDRVVAFLAIEPGARVLDVACGNGGVALRMARAGADVVGIDISADQLAKARRAAASEGLHIRFDEGDCEQLPYADAEFDAVASAFGAIFADDHARTAAGARACLPARWPARAHRLAAGRLGRPARKGGTHVPARKRSQRVVAGGARPRAARRCVRPRAAGRALARRGRLCGSALGSPLQLDAAAPHLARRASDEARARAERVYLDFLASGVLERECVLILGTRR
jgi:SAM-dependent methyltransferase